MEHKEKLTWMAEFAIKNKSAITLEGECGFGRECVGLIVDGEYPDYQWYNEENDYEEMNGEIWVPKNAYHKHPCVAVLGRGKKAEEQLYEWLKWFGDNNFKVVIESNPKENLHPIELMMGRATVKRMVKQNG